MVGLIRGPRLSFSISVTFFGINEERSVSNDVCSDRSMSFRVVFRPGCPVVGNAVMKD